MVIGLQSVRSEVDGCEGEAEREPKRRLNIRSLLVMKSNNTARSGEEVARKTKSEKGWWAETCETEGE